MKQKRILVNFAAIAVLSCFSDIEVLPEKYEDFLAMHGSSSSIEQITSSGSSSNSSSSLLPELAFCRLTTGVCTQTPVSFETCELFGGTPDQSCGGS